MISTNDVIKSIKTALSGKFQAKIMLNLNIAVSKFLATLAQKFTQICFRLPAFGECLSWVF